MCTPDDHVPSCCFAFVLQVVAVKGINPSGSCILVKQLWSHLPPPPARKQQQQQATADAMDIDSVVGAGLGSSAGLSAVVAAGPFCLAEDLSYEPLQELLQELKDKPPNMLVRAAV
jgi:DNA polymerase alpha subunit B